MIQQSHSWAYIWRKFSSVQFSHSVVSDSLKPHGLQHARPPFRSSTSGVYSNSCPLSQWCHPTISFSVVPFSSHLQSFPASGSFQMNQFFTSGGQSTGVSGSTSVLLMNIQDWFILGWTGWISLQSKGLSRVFASIKVQRHQFFCAQPSSLWSKSHIHTGLLPVNPKGNQSWIFIGRTDAEAETPILWPPDVKNWFIGKDPDSGKDWRWEEKGTTEDKMVGWHHWLNGHEFE